MRNRPLLHVSVAYSMMSLSEWAQYFGVLVYAFEQGGTRTAGIASVALLVPFVVAAPVATAVIDRSRPDVVRLVATIAQAVAFTCAAAAAWAGAPVSVVLACGAVAVAMIVFLRPACAVLLPSVVRSPRELSVANVWVGYCESLSVLGGPLLATALLAIRGPELVLGACAAMTVFGVVNVIVQGRSHAPAPRRLEDTQRPNGIRLAVQSLAVLRTRPGATGVLAAAGGQFVLLGSLDLVMVVMATEVFDLGGSGAGVLGTAVGVGAVASGAVSTVLVGRARIAPLLVASLAAITATLAVLTATTGLWVALTVLVVVGFSRSMLDLTARMLLQRSTPPASLPAVFASIELLAGIGMLAGSIAVQIVIAAAGVRTAAAFLAAFYALLLAATWRSLRIADSAADIPVVTISLLRRLPAFAPLPPLALETLARASSPVTAAAGEVVVTEGEPGHAFFAVVDGHLDVTAAGAPIRRLGRGDGFGEVALLADVPRTASVAVSADGPATLLQIERGPFLRAVTGHEESSRSAWAHARTFEFRSARPALAVDGETDGPAPA